MLSDIILQFGWFVCVCVSVCFFEILFAPHLFANMWFGRSRREGKTLMLLKSTSQQVNFTKSLRVWCSFFFFFRFDVDHGAQFFRGKNCPLKFWTKGEKPKMLPAFPQDSEYNTIYDVLKSRGWKETDVDNEWHIFWILRCIWHEVGIGICWQLKSVGIFLAYTWHILGIYLAYTWRYMLMAAISLSTGDCVSGWVKLLLECWYIDESWLAKSWSTSC